MHNLVVNLPVLLQHCMFPSLHLCVVVIFIPYFICLQNQLILFLGYFSATADMTCAPLPVHTEFLPHAADALPQ